VAFFRLDAPISVRRPTRTFFIQGYGLILSTLNRQQDALDQFQSILELDATQHSAKVEIGWIYCQQGKFDEALSLVEEAIETSDEENSEYLYRLGRIYWEMGGEYNVVTCP
jgi:superkiller protein 3